MPHPQMVVFNTERRVWAWKPYSKPTPSVPPQRVLSAETRPIPVVLSKIVKRLPVTAAPPFT